MDVLYSLWMSFLASKRGGIVQSAQIFISFLPCTYNRDIFSGLRFESLFYQIYQSFLKVVAFVILSCPVFPRKKLLS